MSYCKEPGQGPMVRNRNKQFVNKVNKGNRLTPKTGSGLVN